MKDVLKIIVLVIAVGRLLLFIPKLIDAANTEETTVELSPLIASFTGKHFNDSAKQWYTHANVISTSNQQNPVGIQLMSMQIAKLEHGKKQKYLLLFLTKQNTNDTTNPYTKVLRLPKLNYFALDGGQYNKLQQTIANGKKNLSITSKQNGSKLLPSVQEIDYENTVEDIARVIFPNKKQREYETYGIVRPNTLEFIVTTEKEGNNNVVRFLLPSGTEIQLNYFQKNYFEVPLEEFKRMLIK